MTQKTEASHTQESDIQQLQSELARLQTEARQLRQRCEEAEQRFQQVLELVDDALLIIDDTNRIRFVNQKAADLIGTDDAQAVVGRSVYDFVKAEDVSPVRASEAQLRRGQKLEQRHVHILQVSGREVLVEASAVPISYDGAAAVISRAEDVTDRHRAETALHEQDAILHNFYDTVPSMMGVVEIVEDDLCYISANMATADFFGTTREAMHRELASTLDMPADYIRLWVDACRDSRTQESPVRFEYEHQRNGAPRWLTATISYIHTLPTGQDRFSFVILDITDRKEAEQELIEAKERAEDIARLRTAILNNITHEVRTPLTVILGFTSMLRKGVQPQFQRFISLIERSGRRLMLMLDAILDLAQLEVGTLEVVPGPVDVVEIIENAVDTLRPQAADKGLILEVQADAPELPARFDFRIFTRILNNLLDNAIKFTEEGTIRIVVGADDEHLCIAVHDTGVGIDESYLAHVFEEFSQESTGLERTYQGSGLGLAVTRRLIEQMGGSITVESIKGTGSVFTVTMPRYANGHGTS